MSNPIHAMTLSNGLTVITRPTRRAPVATFWVWYRVGARNEVVGLTGISHWVEHMLFKGTPTFKKGDIFRAVNQAGGTLNGFTWIDFTAYFETLPSDRIDLGLRIESDRMVNALFDPSEFESERTVILSERAGSENYPTYHLGEEVRAAAFKVHPYHHPVIGWACDLQAMTRDELYRHYRTYYAPNNALAIAVGDFDEDRLLARVEELFGPIPAQADVPTVRPQEPPQQGERRVIVRRPGPTCYLELAYHAPPASSPDTHAMAVLECTLSGARPMGIFGEGGRGMGRSSRLYRALVDKELCSEVESSFTLSRDPYLFTLAATLRPEVKLEAIEPILFDEVKRLQDELVPSEELERARKQLKAQFTYGSESVTSQGFWLGNLGTIHDHRAFETFLADLDAVTAEDVRRVAQTYLGEQNRTVGWFVPVAQPAGGGAAGNGSVAARANGPCFFAAPGRPAGARLAIEREELPGGIVVIGHENPLSPSVTLRATIRAGAALDPDERSGRASLAARMLIRGTERRTFHQLSELTDSIGASLTAGTGFHLAQVGGRCLAEDVGLMVDLIAEVLRQPTFPPEELEKLRGMTLTSLREQEQNTQAVADRRLRELAYPAGHPYRRQISGTLQSVPAIARDDLVAFHRGAFGPAGMTIVVAGDVQFADFVQRVQRAFGDWQPAEGYRGPAPLQAPPADPPEEQRRTGAVLPGKTQSDIALGRPTLSRKDGDFYALEMANLVLGRLGLMGRLGASVRDRQGLAYYVFSRIDAGPGPSMWEARAGVYPDKVDQAIASILAEVKRLRQELVTEDEIGDATSYLTGVLPLALETNEGVARALGEIELYDLGLDYIDRYPDIIRSLNREALLDAARRWLDEERVAISVAGPK